MAKKSEVPSRPKSSDCERFDDFSGYAELIHPAIFITGADLVNKFGDKISRLGRKGNLVRKANLLTLWSVRTIRGGRL